MSKTQQELLLFASGRGVNGSNSVGPFAPRDDAFEMPHGWQASMFAIPALELDKVVSKHWAESSSF
jgi:hypothetical protein